MRTLRRVLMAVGLFFESSGWGFHNLRSGLKTLNPKLVNLGPPRKPLEDCY